VSPEEFVRQYRWLALPDGWEEMEYKDFLAERRERIARFIATAYKKLEGAVSARVPESLDIEQLIRDGEGVHVELKSTLRVNLHTGQRDPKMELACLKTIAGFLNSRGGTLVVGVTDDGETLGLDRDGFPDEDKMNLHLVNLLRDRVGPQHMMYIHPRFEDRDGHRVLVVDCWPSSSAVFVKDGAVERFYIRTGAATTELSGSQTQDYVKRRF
jgi:predicted HTH transcriptional regulator